MDSHFIECPHCYGLYEKCDLCGGLKKIKEEYKENLLFYPDIYTYYEKHMKKKSLFVLKKNYNPFVEAFGQEEFNAYLKKVPNAENYAFKSGDVFEISVLDLNGFIKHSQEKKMQPEVQMIFTLKGTNFEITCGQKESFSLFEIFKK